MGESHEAWQEFRGSELGGLLSTIYGAPKVQINYPKLSKKKFVPTESFKSSGTKARETVTRRNVEIDVPRVGLEKKSARAPVAAVDCIARRKQESTIKAEIDDIRMRQSYYRPAHRHVIDDQEKERLNQICMYKGGKILPNDLSYPVSETPLEIAAMKKEKDRLSTMREKKMQGRGSTSGSGGRAVLSDLEQLKEQVVGEIDERRRHLESLRSLGLPSNDEGRIKAEISQRIAELHQLDRK